MLIILPVSRSHNYFVPIANSIASVFPVSSSTNKSVFPVSSSTTVPFSHYIYYSVPFSNFFTRFSTSAGDGSEEQVRRDRETAEMVYEVITSIKDLKEHVEQQDKHVDELKGRIAILKYRLTKRDSLIASLKLQIAEMESDLEKKDNRIRVL
jgi:peptidoglycan hydrolase CwlO-like protein